MKEEIVKPTTRVRIGIITGIADVIFLVLFAVFFIVEKNAPFDALFYTLPFAMIFPSVYIFALIKRKYKTVRLIFGLWCVIWIVCYTLTNTHMKGVPVVPYTMVKYGFDAEVSLIVSLAISWIVTSPMCLMYLLYWINFLGFSGIVLDAICAVAGFVLLWIGVGGCGQMTQNKK